MSKKKFELHIPDNHKDKMNQIYDLLLMVHADGVVDDHEVHFCEQVAEKYELQKDVISWLLQYFENEKKPLGPEWDKIIDMSLKFEKKKATS